MLSIRTEHPSDHLKIYSVLSTTGCIQEGVNLSLSCEGTKHLSFVACWTLSGYTPDIGMPQASCVLYLLLLNKT